MTHCFPSHRFLIHCCICCIYTALSASMLAQSGAGETEIYVADVKKSGGTYTIASPVNVSRHVGYDNQPSFTPDNRYLLFSSIRNDEAASSSSSNGQAISSDIYRYSFKDSSLVRLTKTPESEFSPAVMPSDGLSISVVRVGLDSSQSLWQYDSKGNNPLPLLKNVQRIGYYAWIGSSHLGLYVLGSEQNPPSLPTLQLIAVEDSLAVPDTVEAKIGRCLRRVPSSIALSQKALSYIHKTNDSVWTLKRVNINNRIQSQIMLIPAGVEDYAWTQNGTVLIGVGRRILARHARKDNNWREIANFERTIPSGAIKRISMSLDEKRIAFVIQDEPSSSGK